MGLIREPLNVDFYVNPRPLKKGDGKKSANIFVNTKQKWLKEKAARSPPKKKPLVTSK